jgi:hypothetical protein
MPVHLSAGQASSSSTISRLTKSPAASRWHSRTCFLASFSSSFNQSSVKWPMSIIHSRIFSRQSCSSSQSSLSFDLYRSCEPEVEWPCGCVISVTCISTGTCSVAAKRYGTFVRFAKGYIIPAFYFKYFVTIGVFFALKSF